MTRMYMALGDATDVRTRGGSPYFLYSAGKKEGFFDSAAALRLGGREHRRRQAWNLYRLLSAGERGGFQFSRGFAEWLFREAGLRNPATEVISEYQLFPPDSWLGRSRITYYIDATMRQNFRDYGLGAVVGPRMRSEVVSREQARFASAERIICRCRWAARSLVNEYSVPPGKIHVIVGGANVDEGLLRTLPRADPPPLKPVRLGFVGGDWRRKNLAFLLEIVDALAARNVPAEVHAAGFPPAVGPIHPRLHAIGRLDKSREMRKFIDFIRSMHFGCLFSSAEAAPRFNRECLRLGVPVLTWDVGGMADTVPPGLGHVFPPGSDAATIAALIAEYADDAERYANVRERVALKAHEFSWDHAISQFQAVWQGSKDYCFEPRGAGSPVLAASA